MQPTRIVRRHGLCGLTNLSLATVYRLIRAGQFPKQIRLSAQAVGWDLAEVNEWIERRKACRSSGVAR